MSRPLLIAALLLATSPAWGAYTYYRTITTDHTQAGTADSSSFPVLVMLSNGGVGYSVGTTLKTVANGGHVNNTVTQSGGVGGTEPADLVFGTTNTCSTLLPWETESYSATTGTLIAWVKLSTLHHSSNDTFYMCYGDASVTTQQNTGAFSPSFTWDFSYKGVYHFIDGTTLNLIDSGNAANTMTHLNNTSTATAGIIDGGVSYTGQNDTTTSSFAIGAGSNWSVEYWVNLNNVSYGKGTWTLGLSNNYADTFDGTNIIFRWAGVTVQAAMTTGSWVHVAMTVDSAGTTMTLYLNGVSVASGSSAANTSQNTFITGSNVNDFMSGTMDEMRASTAVRSSSWITADYNNQKASSTFLTIGAQTGGSVAYNAAVLDALSAFDAGAGVAAHFATPRDTALAFERATGFAAHFGVVSDRIYLSESSTVHGAHFAVPSDAPLLSERATGFAAHFGAASDRTYLAEGSTGLAAHFAGPSDAPLLSESAAAHAAHFGAVSDAMRFSDTGVEFAAHLAAAADAMRLSDGGSTFAAHFATAFDTSRLGEGVTALRVKLIFVSDVMGAFDSAARIAGLHVAGVDAPGVSDAASESAGLHVSASDALGLREGVTRGRAVSVSDVLAGADAASRLAAHYALASDVLVMASTVGAIRGRVVSVSDGTAVVEVSGTQAGRFRAVLDAMGLRETLEHTGSAAVVILPEHLAVYLEFVKLASYLQSLFGAYVKQVTVLIVGQ